MNDRPERDPDHAVHDRDQEEQTRAVVHRPEPPQPEHDAALVLGQDLDGVGDQQDHEEQREQGTDHGGTEHGYPFSDRGEPGDSGSATSTVSIISSARTTMRCPWNGGIQGNPRAIGD